MKTIIKGGTVITATDTFAADLLLDCGRIAQIGADLPAAGARVVDAAGMLLLPGGIDVHTHLELPFFGTVAADDFYTGQRAAAFGGTTSHIDFAIQYKGESLHQAVENWQHKARDKAVLDYGLHVAITDLNDTVMAEIPALASAGVTTIKLFQAYKGVYQVDDATLFRSGQPAKRTHPGFRGRATMTKGTNLLGSRGLRLIAWRRRPGGSVMKASPTRPRLRPRTA